MSFVTFIIYYLLFTIISIPVHEFGHMVFGFVTGYKFSSFRLLSFVWVKENGKIVMKKSKNSLILGQCLMSPPENEKDFKFFWYNLGGGFFNLCSAIIFVPVFLLGNDYLKDIAVAGFVANFTMGAMNLIPLSMSVPNDGMNIFKAMRSNSAKHGLYIILYINNAMMKGKRFRDFNEKLFEIDIETDLGNYLAAYPVICEAARLYDLGDYDGSFEKCGILDISKFNDYYSNTIKLEYLYYYIVHHPDFEKAKNLYNDPKLKKFLKLNIPTLSRIHSAYEFFINNDREKGKQLLDKARKEIESIPNEGHQIMERDYISDLEKYMGINE